LLDPSAQGGGVAQARGRGSPPCVLHQRLYARAFGRLWGRLGCPRLSRLCARCGRRGYLFRGIYINGAACCTLHARHCCLRGLRCALSFLGQSCVSSPSLLCLILQPALYALLLCPPTIYPSPPCRPSPAHAVTDYLTCSAPRSASYNPSPPPVVSALRSHLGTRCPRCCRGRGRESAGSE
jgi:hypothetical protein